MSAEGFFSGRVVHLLSGGPRDVVRAGAQFLRGSSAVRSPPLDAVVVSAGGAPYDIDFVQAHKAIEAVCGVVRPGGTVVLVAACGEGLPAAHREYLGLGVGEIAERLGERFSIAGQTMHAHRDKAESRRILAFTRMPEELVWALGMTPIPSLEAVAGEVRGAAAVVPHGARVLLEPA